MFTVSIIRNIDSGTCITRLPGTDIPCTSLADAAKCLAQLRAAGIHGAGSECNDVAVVFYKGGKRVGWLTREVFKSFKTGKDLKDGMVKPDVFGYNTPENVL